MNQTTPVYIGSSRKTHGCSWCSELIEAGEGYVRWRWFGGDDPTTVKLHLECEEAMNRLIAEEGGYEIEWTPGQNPRGCNCGYDAFCSRCNPRN